MGGGGVGQGKSRLCDPVAQRALRKRAIVNRDRAFALGGVEFVDQEELQPD